MTPWKTLKTLDGIAIEIRALEPTAERREWEVRSLEGLQLRVCADSLALKEPPPGIAREEQEWTESEIERAVLHVVALALVSRQAPGEIRQVVLTKSDLYGANGLT